MTSINELNKEINLLTQENEELDKEINFYKQLQKEKNKYIDSNTKLDRDINILKDKIENLNTELFQNKNFLYKLQNEKKENDYLKENLEKFNQKYNEWKGKSNEEKEKFIKSIESDINQYRRQKEAILKKLEKMEKEKQ